MSDGQGQQGAGVGVGIETGPGWHAGAVPPPQVGTAMSLVLTGRQHTPGDAVREFESYLHRQGMSRRELWGLWEQAGAGDGAAVGGAVGGGHPGWAAAERMRAAVMGLPQPGKTAMLFVSPAVGGWAGGGRAGVQRVAGLAGEVSARLLSGMDEDESGGPSVRIVQALLDPGQALEQETLSAAGFARLAKLVYMARTLDPGRRGAELDLNGALPGDAGEGQAWQERGYSPLTHPAFAAAVLASYEDTLDCPGLLGLRTIEDVLAGHRATGRFDASLWRLVMVGDEPAAVILLAAVGLPSGDGPKQNVDGTPATAAGGAAAETYELVYLGVSKRFRGRGLAGRLLRYGMGLVHARGGRRLLLAVDDRNEPAVSLYRSLGFRATARKLAMIRSK
ncbi:MAG: GNAT family N-acetyltransferase [Planctomycetota bacterium]